MPADLASLIAHDHQVIGKLLDALGDTGRADRFPLAHRVIDEIAAHTASELQILHPALRDIVPGGVAMANRGQTNYDTLRPVLVRLGAGPSRRRRLRRRRARSRRRLRRPCAAGGGRVPPRTRRRDRRSGDAGDGRGLRLRQGQLPGGLDALPGDNPSPTFRPG